jgi:ATP-dependent Lhr-like helicase
MSSSKKPTITSNPFDCLTEPIPTVLQSLKITQLTEPQRIAIQPIINGENVLLISPAGSGKTEACLLPIFHHLLKRSSREGISILYITPLRALNRDMLKRLLYWGECLNITIQVRHGDTSQYQRRKQAVKPPDMLITTPESLQAILPGTRIRHHLKNIRWIIVDEIHELVTNRRGIQLSVALERLEELTDNQIQRIGISATVDSPYEVGSFLVGTHRSVTVLEARTAKNYSFKIEHPIAGEEEVALAQRLYTSPEVAARILRIKELVEQHMSTLIFVNSRQHAEMLGLRFNMLDHSIAVHHGSLSKEERHTVEDSFKRRKLKGILCTSTLQLGIDVGSINLVIQYLSPRQVTPLLQRVGRSGHQSTLTSRGYIITVFPDDSLESLVIVEQALKGELEKLTIPMKPLDVLAHQIAGLVLEHTHIPIDKLHQIIRKAFPYSGLNHEELGTVISFMDELRLIHFEQTVLHRDSRTHRYYYENLSTIPDERIYPIIDLTTDKRVGILGEEFVLTKARVGMNFICRGFVWKIMNLSDQQVYVTPADDPLAAIPGWDGELLPLPFDIARKVGEYRREISTLISTQQNKRQVIDALVRRYPLERYTVRTIAEEIMHHLHDTPHVPSDSLILLEGYRNYLIIHSCFGDGANRTIGCLLEQVYSQEGSLRGWWGDGYRLLIEFSSSVSNETLDSIKEFFYSIHVDQIEELTNHYLADAHPFAYHMKFIAQRFGALPRGAFLSSEKLLDLPYRFRKTPIYTETISEFKRAKFDISAVQTIINNIQNQTIHIETLNSVEHPTLPAYRILNKFAAIPDMIAPESIQEESMHRMETAIKYSTIELFCVNCGDWSHEQKISTIPTHPKCGRCGSGLLAPLKYSNEYVKKVVKKRVDQFQLTEDEQRILVNIRRHADIVLSYGKKGVIALQVHGIGPQTAARLLAKMHYTEKEFFNDLLEAKLLFIRTRRFWKS